MTIEKNKNVNAHADDGDGPVQQILLRARKPYAKQPCYHPDDLEQGLVLPPGMQCVCDMHVQI